MKIAGVVILYEPEDNFLEHIKTYYDYLDILYIIDNSVKKHNKELNGLMKCKYIFNNGNNGIANSLNKVVKKLENIDWLLTMDQDSFFIEDSFKKMLEDCKFEKDVAIYAPIYKANKIIEFCDNDIVITSGNILNVNICKKIGMFDEKIFIDGVDHDYCMRALIHNYKIKIIKSGILHHTLGNIEYHNFFGKKIMVTNYSPIRRYYITRNRLYLYKKHKDNFEEFCKNELKFSQHEFFKILLFEKQKIKKIKMILRAKCDFKKNKMGRID